MILALATTVIGRELIVESTKKVIDVMSDINEHNDYYVNLILQELDIYACVKVIHSMMTFIEKKENNEIIKLCIDDLHTIINKIEKELGIIKKLIPEHKTKWFYSFRTPKYYNNVENIKLYKKILDKRLEMFINILRIK